MPARGLAFDPPAPPSGKHGLQKKESFWITAPGREIAETRRVFGRSRAFFAPGLLACPGLAVRAADVASCACHNWPAGMRGLWSKKIPSFGLFFVDTRGVPRKHSREKSEIFPHFFLSRARRLPQFPNENPTFQLSHNFFVDTSGKLKKTAPVNLRQTSQARLTTHPFRSLFLLCSSFTKPCHLQRPEIFPAMLPFAAPRPGTRMRPGIFPA